MNLIALIGNVALEPEMEYNNSGRGTCRFIIAIPRSSGGGADYFNVVAEDRQAEVCNEYLTAGRRVSVEGRIQHTLYSSEGNAENINIVEARQGIEIVANRVQLLGAPVTPTEKAVARIAS